MKTRGILYPLNISCSFSNVIFHDNIHHSPCFQKIFSWPKCLFYYRFSILTRQKIWKRSANKFQPYRKSAAMCFPPSSMKAAKQMNKITSNNLLINVYHYWGFAKRKWQFPRRGKIVHYREFTAGSQVQIHPDKNLVF